MNPECKVWRGLILGWPNVWNDFKISVNFVFAVNIFLKVKLPEIVTFSL